MIDPGQKIIRSSISLTIRYSRHVSVRAQYPSRLGSLQMPVN
jgi:hypothetical protein